MYLFDKVLAGWRTQVVVVPAHGFFKDRICTPERGFWGRNGFCRSYSVQIKFNSKRNSEFFGLFSFLDAQWSNFRVNLSELPLLKKAAELHLACRWKRNKDNSLF